MTGCAENDKQGSQGALAFPSQRARCEGQEEGCKDRNEAMPRTSGEDEAEKTLKRDGANATEGSHVSPS